MGSIVIRDLDESTISRIDALAKDKKMSRERFLRNVLRNISVAGDVKDVENKYTNIVEQLVEMLQTTASILERNTDIMERLEQNMEEEHESRY